MIEDTRVSRTSSRNVVTAATLLLIFLAIAAYGGEYVWQEAAFLGGVFVVTGLTFMLRPTDLSHLSRRLFLPILLLSAYSLLQGVTPLLLGGEAAQYIGSLPYGFDATVSLWSGVKVLGFACMLALCIIALRLSRGLFINGLVLIGSVFAAFGIARFVLQHSFPDLNYYILAPELRPGVGFGTFLNQNHFALLMLMTLGLSIGPLLKGNVIRSKKLFVGAALLAWIATVLTASRGGIIGSFLVVITLMAFALMSVVGRYRRGNIPRSRLYAGITKSVVAAILLVVALVVGVGLVGQDRVLHRFEELPRQIEGTAGVAFRRPDVWEATSKMIQVHYVYGIGFGGFRYAVSQFIDISGDFVPQQSHNDYLEFVASGGVISSVLLIWFVWIWLLESYSSRNRSPDKMLSAFGIGAICGIVGVAFHSFADFGLQYVGNQAFFAALISIVVSPVANEPEPREPTSSRGRTAFGITTGVVLIVFCGVCAVFGSSRYLQIVAAPGIQLKPPISIPFDAEHFSVLADQLNRRGEINAAAGALRTATRLRGEDHKLWLRLARLEATMGDNAAAEDAYQKAIKLAPLYGEPHFAYGLFLVDISRTAEGVNELVFAARRDRRFTDAVLERIWGRTQDLQEHLADLIADGNLESNMRITRFLLSKERYDLIAELSCRVEFSELERDMLVRQLLERRSVRNAWRVYRRKCDEKDEPPDFINGDFETSELTRGLRFGWVVGDSLKKTNLAMDPASPAHGRQSLRLNFDGDIRPVFLRQIFPIRTSARYTVSFSYKSLGILTGEPLILEIVLKRQGTDVRVGEVELSADKLQWEKHAISFEADSHTEAVEVNLTSRPCRDTTCPIFGELWVDNFEIVELSRAEIPRN